MKATPEMMKSHCSTHCVTKAVLSLLKYMPPVCSTMTQKTQPIRATSRKTHRSRDAVPAGDAAKPTSSVRRGIRSTSSTETIHSAAMMHLDDTSPAEGE